RRTRRPSTSLRKATTRSDGPIPQDPSGLELMAPSGSGYCDKECQKRLQEQEKRAKEAAAALEKERRRLLSLLARYTGQCLFGMRNPGCESARREVVA